MPSSRSLVGRAVFAVVLMLGFYALAITVVGALIYIPYADWTYTKYHNLKNDIFCILGAAIIIWSVLPRPDDFTPPGPVLQPREHPKLFETLTGIAKATGQEMPSEVYMIAEMNAWVMYRGGVMGFGSRRVMALGLPLLTALNIPQLRAVLAHEFGHFYNGDTKLGPWVYKTRDAIGRTLEDLEELSSLSQNYFSFFSLLKKPFLWYGKAFLRVTHAVSRSQEFAADELATRIVGSCTLIEALKLVHGASVAFNTYWTNEVRPLLSRGFHPPIAEGFRRYLALPHIAEVVSASINYELAEGQAGPYDTHPSLRERIAALQSWPQGEMLGHDLPAITLVENIEWIETRLLGSMPRPVIW